MISYKFTLLDLTDLALRVPEVGAVNFNILHAVLSALIKELGLDTLKIPCYIEDETLAQTAVTKNRMSMPKGTRKPSKLHTVQEIKGKVARLGDDTSESSHEKDTLEDNKKTPTEDSESKERQNVKTSDDTTTLKDENAVETKNAEETLEKKSDESETYKEKESDKELTYLTESEKAPSETEVSTKDSESAEGQEVNTLDDETTAKDESVLKTKYSKQVLERKDDDIETRTVKENDEERTDLKESDKAQSDEKLKDEEDAPEVSLSDAMEVLMQEIEEDPTKVIEEMWRSTNINRRMDAAESGLRELSSIIDMTLDKVQDMEDQSEELFKKSRELIEEIGKFIERIKSIEDNCKTLALRIEDCNEKREEEVNRLDEVTDEIKKDQHETKAVITLMEAKHDDLADKVAYKEDLNELQKEMSEELEDKIKETKKLMWEIEDTLVKKENFAELTTRVESVEDNKVNRDELGRLLEPGFIDNFLEEQQNLRKELEELKEKVDEIENDLRNLKKMIDEEVIKVMEEKFSEVNSTLDTMNEKLALLDPDEINDSFANLEEQAAMIMKELEELKLSSEQFQKEARVNFNKISNFHELITKLEKTKVDKTKMYELLETKADVDMLMNKLDRSEFVSVVGDMNDTLERLTITVKINEEEMQRQFTVTQQDLTLKMYTEDFITATQPIRNRIKALIYELESVKQISLTHLFPDAPGITKCISCKRGAQMAGPKYLGDMNESFLQEVPPKSQRFYIQSRTGSKSNYSDEKQIPGAEKLPPVNLEKVPIPSPEQEREKDVLRLPVLFATARPKIGLVHEKRRSEIDKELATYFATRNVRPIAGEYTRTMPQQRGLSFATVMFPSDEKEEVLLEGVNKNVYKGKLYDESAEDVAEDSLEKKDKEPASQEKDEKTETIKSLREPRAKKGFIKPIIKPRQRSSELRETLEPTVVRFHKTMSPTVQSQNMMFPTPYIEKVRNISDEE